MSKALQKVENSPDLVNAPSNDVASVLAEMAGAGFEGTTKDDYALPFIHVMQKMSPQVDKHHAKYIRGAEAGFFMNTVTQEVFNGEEGIVVIPVDFKKVFLEWIPRDLGGGLVAEYSTREEALSMQSTDKKTEIIDTANHYILVKTPTGWEAAVLSCTSTKLKASRNWMSLMSRVTVNGKPAPSFAKKYLLKTVLQTNDKGNYFNIKAEPIEGLSAWLTVDELQQALAFYKQIRSGEKKLDFSASAETEQRASYSADNDLGDEDVPF